mmetsp:Transcript_26536/g.54756  ORF Transcript_26536/g.54756 Transcript_26536/m.54756 type:complete len:344 (-) Transcript_26536:906-1937(-)
MPFEQRHGFLPSAVAEQLAQRRGIPPALLLGVPRVGGRRGHPRGRSSIVQDRRGTRGTGGHGIDAMFELDASCCVGTRNIVAIAVIATITITSTIVVSARCPGVSNAAFSVTALGFFRCEVVRGATNALDGITRYIAQEDSGVFQRAQPVGGALRKQAPGRVFHQCLEAVLLAPVAGTAATVRIPVGRAPRPRDTGLFSRHGPVRGGHVDRQHAQHLCRRAVGMFLQQYPQDRGGGPVQARNVDGEQPRRPGPALVPLPTGGWFFRRSLSPSRSGKSLARGSFPPPPTMGSGETPEESHGAQPDVFRADRGRPRPAVTDTRRSRPVRGATAGTAAVVGIAPGR